MPQRKHQYAFNVGQKTVQRQVPSTPPRDDQLALPEVDLAADLRVLHQNLQRFKNQNDSVLGGLRIGRHQKIAEPLQILQRQRRGLAFRWILSDQRFELAEQADAVIATLIEGWAPRA